MAAFNEKYNMCWNDHAKNFSISLENLLQNKELVDVTLVADGYSINAHRLVLAAMSPYFRQMFIQVPANQQAFVFMKDVSKSALDDLITFIYSGEVNVKQNDLENFLSIAKALKIKGLIDDAFAHPFNSETLNTVWETNNRSQYQSSHTVRIQNMANFKSTTNLYDLGCYEQQRSTNVYHQSETFPNENDNQLNENNFDDDYDGMVNGSSFIDYEHNNGQDDGLVEMTNTSMDHRQQNDGRKCATADGGISKPKRSKHIDVLEYTNMADIRQNASGRKNLFHIGFKFNKNGNGLKKQLWQCTNRTEKCRASASTMDVNGVIMMKILIAEHSHAPAT